MSTSIGDLVHPRRVEEIRPKLAEAAAQLRRDSTAAPWFVQLALAIGLFVASAFTCGGIAGIAFEPVLFGGVGLFLALVSSAVSWLPMPWFVRPILLVSVVLARLLVLASVVDNQEMPLVMAALEFMLLLLHRDPLNRLFAAFAAPAYLASKLEHWLEWVTLATFLPSALLLLLRRLWLGLGIREVIHPMVMGSLMLALALPSVPGDAWSGVLSAVMGLVCAGCAVAVSYSLGLRWYELAVSGIFPILIAAMTVTVPGVGVAMLLAVLGFLSRSPGLWGIALGATTMYGARAMYQLDWGLWAKGGAMITAGLALILVGQLAGRYRVRS